MGQNSSWIQHDYGKPGLPYDVQGKVWTPELKDLYVKEDADGCSFLVNSAFDPVVSKDFGAAAGWTQVDISDESINVSIGMFNKSTTRIPEAMFVQVLPSQPNAKYYVNKLGGWIGYDEVVSGGTKHLHGIMESGLRVDVGSQRMSISALDAAVVNFGELTAYPSPVTKDPDVATYGASFVLWDNLWGTNYVMWWPFVVPPPEPYASSSAYFPEAWNNDMISRFQIKFVDQEPPSSKARPTLWV